MPNINWYFIIIVLLAFLLKNNNKKMFITISVLGIIFFLVCSTSYVPKKLISSIENNFSPIELNQFDTSKKYYILVLGAGASNDNRLPASMNINTTTLTRLVEGVRIYRHLKHSILVTSACIDGEKISQAELSKEAAISLGVNGQNIQMLKTPTSTLDEALAFKEKFGTKTNLILVTSAIHMPRAVEIFSDQNIKVVPAPTGYLYKKNKLGYNGITFPSFESLELTNSYQTALVKHLYYKLFKKK